MLSSVTDIWTIAFAADCQFGHGDSSKADIISNKKNTVKVIQENKYNVVITAGDLTENGYDGKDSYFGLFRDKSQGKQLQKYIDDWERPIEQATEKYYATIGNHDHYVKWPYFYKPVLNHIKKKYKTTSNQEYMNIHNGIGFISCGMYPKNIDWLVANIILCIGLKYKCIIFFHCTLNTNEKGKTRVPYSDWWSDEEQELFYERIKPYKDMIIAIAYGHYHSSFFVDNWKGFLTICSGGSDLPVLKMQGNNLIDKEIVKTK